MQTHCILILRHYRANRAQFAEVAFHTVSDEDVQEIPLPSMHSTAEDDSKHYLSPRRWKLSNILVVIEGLAALTTQDAPVDVFSTPPQLDGELVTLTLLPRSRWQTLLNLDVIQVSNISRPLIIRILTCYCSNETNQKNHRRLQKKRHSSYLRSRELKHNLS